MLTTAFAPRLAPDNVVVNACHPGDVDSKLSNDLGFAGLTPGWIFADAPDVPQTVVAWYGQRALAAEVLHEATRPNYDFPDRPQPGLGCYP
jgi:NAD(P)-dependent dehydrogenase (short-subunit alcohol dehydrogenase family)